MRSLASEVATRDELLLLLSGAARRGNVGAMRVLLEELRRDAGDEDASDPFSGLDELAPRRKRA